MLLTSSWGHARERWGLSRAFGDAFRHRTGRVPRVPRVPESLRSSGEFTCKSPSHAILTDKNRGIGQTQAIIPCKNRWIVLRGARKPRCDCVLLLLLSIAAGFARTSGDNPSVFMGYNLMRFANPSVFVGQDGSLNGISQPGLKITLWDPAPGI